MDFKRHFALNHERCHPLTVLDDHSRFNLALRACANDQGTTVQAELTATCRHYGLPARCSWTMARRGGTLPTRVSRP